MLSHLLISFPPGRGSGRARGAVWRVRVCDCDEGPLARDHRVCIINNEGALKKRKKIRHESILIRNHAHMNQAWCYLCTSLEYNYISSKVHFLQPLSFCYTKRRATRRPLRWGAGALLGALGARRPPLSFIHSDVMMIRISPLSHCLSVLERASCRATRSRPLLPPSVMHPLYPAGAQRVHSSSHRHTIHCT